MKKGLFHIFGFCFILTGCLETGMRNRPTLPRAGLSGQTSGASEIKEGERPDQHVFLQTDTCGCQNGKPITLGDCFSFCQSKSHDEPILYGFTQITEDLKKDARFGSLYNWCLAEIDDGFTNPSCYLEARSADGNIKELAVDEMKENSLAFQVYLDQLALNRTYVVTLVESSSGARSNSLNLRRTTPVDVSQNYGVLKIDPIIQYTCVLNQVSAPNSSVSQSMENAFRIFFYYNQKEQPLPIPPGAEKMVFCHDFQTTGSDQDRADFPRLESMQAFPAWSHRDFRFADNDRNGAMDIMDQLMKRLETLTGRSISQGSVTGSFFYPFRYPNFPSGLKSGQDSGSDNSQVVNESQDQSLGLFMLPFFDLNIGTEPFCPKKEQYLSNENVLLRALGEVIGVDTEGIYFAHQEKNSTIRNGEAVKAPDNYLLIREELLKRIWFHYDTDPQDSAKNIPTSLEDTPESAGSKTAYFYWPAPSHHLESKTGPYYCNEATGVGSTTCSGGDCRPYHLSKRCNQDRMLFRLKHPSEFGVGKGDNFQYGHTYVGQSSGSGGASYGSTIAYDKKFACIPKL